MAAAPAVRILVRFLTQLLEELVLAHYTGMFACEGCKRLESASEERTAEELTLVFVNIDLTNIKAEHREEKYCFL